jgi:hypothetical protein
MIRFYYQQDPSVFSDDEWAKAVSEIQYCLQVEKRMTASAMAEILALMKS